MKEHEETQYCFQDRNSSCKKASISTSVYITLYTLCSVISAITVCLNLLVIISISHFKQLHTPSNLLILSLAVSDFLVGLFVIPAMTAAIMETCWIIGEYNCALLLYINFLCSSSSLCNLVMISIDRYVAVSDPLLYPLKITISRIKYSIFLTWCACIIYDVVLMKIYINIQVPSRCFEECIKYEGHFWVIVFEFILTVVAPCSIIITLYIKIFLVARSQARQVFSKHAATLSGVKTVQANKYEIKAAKTLGIVVFNYLLFWNPFIFIIIFFSSYSVAPFINAFLPLINSFTNPIIYAIFYPWFRVTAKRILSLKLSYC